MTEKVTESTGSPKTASVSTPEKKKEAKSMIGQIVTHKTRLVSLDKRYRRQPYPFTVPRSQSSGKLLTGQQEILSEDQMIGKEKLTAADKRKLLMGSTPYIINPENVYPCKHGRTYDLSYEINGPDPEDREYINPKDYAEYTFFVGQKELICYGKDKYQINRHLFYVEDKEKEAIDELNAIDRRWDAESFVRNELASSRYQEIIMLLNFEVPKFIMDPKVMSDTLLRSTIYKACQEHPEVILKLKGDDANQLVFVLKLMSYRILERRNNTDFYAGETFVGTTLESVKLFCAKSENSDLVTKWGRQIEQKEGN